MKGLKKTNILFTCSLAFIGASLAVGGVISANSTYRPVEVAYAWSGTGSGTISDPYIINSAEELAAFRTEVSSNPAVNARLNANITLDSWTPIDSFSGVFDGNMHTITFNISSSSSAALFNTIAAGGTVENLKTAGSIINTNTGSSDAAMRNAVIALENKGTIYRVSNSADISYSSASFNDTYDFGAGAAAFAYNNYGTIRECENHGNMSGQVDVGGIAVYQYFSAVIENCYNDGTIACTATDTYGYAAGGIVARIKSFEVDAPHTIYLKRVFNYGAVNAVSNSNVKRGGIVGISEINGPSEYEAGYIYGIWFTRSGEGYVSNVMGQGAGNLPAGWNYKSLTAEEFTNRAKFDFRDQYSDVACLDFTKVWGIKTGDAHPLLRAFLPTHNHNFVYNGVDNVITATCSNEDYCTLCDNDPYFPSGAAKLTISSPRVPRYTGLDKPATTVDSSRGEAFPGIQVSYTCSGQPVVGNPVNVGTYVATVSFGGSSETASTTFTVANNVVYNIAEMQVGDVIYEGDIIANPYDNSNRLLNFPYGRVWCDDSEGLEDYEYYNTYLVGDDSPLVLRKNATFITELDNVSDLYVYGPLDESGNKGNGWMVSSIDTYLGIPHVSLVGIGKEEPGYSFVRWDTAAEETKAYYDEEDGIIYNHNVKDGITITFEGSRDRDGINYQSLRLREPSSNISFSTTNKLITRIELFANEIKNDFDFEAAGWTMDKTNNKMVWTGSSYKVDLSPLAENVYLINIQNIVFTLLDQGEAVALADGVAYTDLPTAFASCQNNGTVKLLADADFTDLGLITIYKDITIDVNGHVFTTDDNSINAIKTTSGHNITFINSVPSKGGFLGGLYLVSGSTAVYKDIYTSLQVEAFGPTTPISAPDGFIVDAVSYTDAKYGEGYRTFIRPAHEHNWKYTVSDNTITAECQNEGCPITEGLTLTIVDPANLTFDDAAKTITFADGYNAEAFPNTSVTIEYYKDNVKVDSCEDAGTYEARVTIGDVTATKQFTIAQATPTGYGEPTAPTIKYGDKLGDIELDEGWSWKDGTEVVDTVGEHEFILIYTPADPNYKPVEVTITFTVNKANSTCTSPTAVANLEYSGSEQTLIDAGSTSDGTMKYSLDGTNYSESLPKGTNAGEYTVYYKVVGDANHNDTTPATVVVNIAKKGIAPTVSINGWNYGENANAPTVSGNTGSGAVSYLYKVKGAEDSTYTATVPTNAGQYTVKATVEATANYLGNTATVDFVIGQATPTGYGEPTKPTIKYGGTLGDIELDEGWSWKDDDEVVNTVGEHEFILIYTPADPNYKPVEVTITITVDKADPTYVVPTDVKGLTNHPLSDVKLPEGWSWKDPTQNVGSEEGEHKFLATFTPSDTEHYNVLNDIEITIIVVNHVHDWKYTVDGDTITAECQNEGCPITEGLTLTVTVDDDVIYDGTDKTPALPTGIDTAVFPNPVIKYYKGGQEVETCEEAGTYEIKVTVGEVTVTKEFTIGQATPTGYEEPTEVVAKHGDKLADITLPEGWSWKDPTEVVNGAGEHEFILIYTPEDPNYKPVEVTITVTVDKANPTYVVPTDVEAPYDVTLSKVALPEGFSWMSPEEKVNKWGENTFIAKFTPSDTANYNIVENIEIKVNVKWILVDPTQGNVSVTINGDNEKFTVDITVKVEVKTEISVDQKRTSYASVGKEFVRPNEDITAIYGVKLIRTTNGVEEEIQPSDIKEGTKITVYMDIPEELVGKDFRLLHIHNANDVTEVTNYAVTKDGKRLVVEIDRLSEFAFIGASKTADNGFNYSTGLPAWAIALIVVGAVLLSCCLFILFLFLFFPVYYVDYSNKEVRRAIKIKSHGEEVVMINTHCQKARRNKADVFKNIADAKKVLG